jgi:RNA polymerase sigma-70 factor (ECF subfamily)
MVRDVSSSSMNRPATDPRGDDHDAPRLAADFDAVFRQHYDPMVRSLAVATGDREAAADAVQDAFVRAFTRWRRISRYDDPAGWVRHVALNRLRDHFRRVERGRRAVDRLGRQEQTAVDAPSLPPDDTALVEAVAALPRQQRVVVALFYVEQLSVREVADAMRLSAGAVKYHLHAARSRLRSTVEAV